jgi:PAS domain S-box-containing protein
MNNSCSPFIELNSIIDFEPLVVSLHTSLLEVVTLMTNYNNHCLLSSNTQNTESNLQKISRGSCVLIVENKKILGLITERDLVRLSIENLDFALVQVQEVMTRNIITLKESDFQDIFVVLSIFRQYNIRHLPIVNDQDELVGLLTSERIRQCLRPNDLLRMRRVEEIMTPEVVTAFPDSSVEELAKLMNIYQISCVVIIEDNQKNILPFPLGIVTERDLVQFKALNLDLQKTKAENVMSYPLFFVNSHSSLWEVQQKMESKNIRHLVCCNQEGGLVGIVSQSSLLRSLDPFEMSNIIKILQNRVNDLENKLEKVYQFSGSKKIFDSLTKINILIIEDDNTTVNILRQRLELERQHKFNLIHCFTLREGLEIIAQQKENNFDLVILDLNLPDSQGLATLTQFKLKYKEIAVIVLTGNYQQKLALKAIKEGAQDYLIKEVFLGKVNREQETFTLPLLTAIERQNKENKLAQQNLEISLINEKLQQSLEENREIKQTLETFNIQLENRVKQKTAKLRNVIEKLKKEIKKRQQIQKDLSLSKQQLDKIINDASDGILIVDYSGVIRFANLSGTHLLQKDKESIIGKEFGTPLGGDQPPQLTIVGKNGEMLFEEMRFNQTEWEGKPAYLILLRNINERLEYETNLRESEENFRQLAENIEEVFFIFDIYENKLIYLSSIFEKIWGVSIDKIVENPNIWFDSVYEQDIQVVFSFWFNSTNQIIDSPRDTYSFDCEYRIVRPNGEIRWIHQRCFQVKNDFGDIYLTVGILTDITERKNTQEYLERLNQELENQVNLRTKELSDFKSALDQSAIVTISDPDGNITYTNDKFCYMCGYTKEELMGQNHRVVNSSYHSAEFWQDFWLCISKGNIWRGEVKNKTKNGGFFWVDMVVVPFFDEHNNISQYIAIRYDITERKQAQELIEQNLATFNAAMDGMAIVDNEQYIYMNRAHLEMFGYSHLQELPDNNWRSLYYPDEINRIETEIFPLLIKDKKWSGEAIAKRKDGTNFTEELSLTLTEKATIICVCRDITKRKQEEAQLKEALTKAEEVNELKSRLITLTSHEFRTPLAVISSSVGILKKFAHKLSEEQKQEHFNTIEIYVEHTTRLLDDILLINRAEAGKLDYNPERLNIVDFCQNLVTEMQGTSVNHEIIFHLTNSTQLTPDQYYRLLDRKLLTQIITNLLSNSIKYSVPNTKVELSLTIEPKSIILQVKDQGIGIPLEAQKHLFENFYRADNVGNIQGTGLGLPIVKECVNLCKGTITIESKVNQGTTFSVNIPC